MLTSPSQVTVWAPEKAALRLRAIDVRTRQCGVLSGFMELMVLDALGLMGLKELKGLIALGFMELEELEELEELKELEELEEFLVKFYMDCLV